VTGSAGTRSVSDVARARTAVAEAGQVERAGDRFLAGHLAALRVAAIVLAARAGPLRVPRPRNAWRTVAEVAPELAEWALLFAATEAERDAVRAGEAEVVSAEQADALVSNSGRFLALVERALAGPATPVVLVPAGEPR